MPTGPVRLQVLIAPVTIWYRPGNRPLDDHAGLHHPAPDRLDRTKRLGGWFKGKTAANADPPLCPGSRLREAGSSTRTRSEGKGLGLALAPNVKRQRFALARLNRLFQL